VPARIGTGQPLDGPRIPRSTPSIPRNDRPKYPAPPFGKNPGDKARTDAINKLNARLKAQENRVDAIAQDIVSIRKDLVEIHKGMKRLSDKFDTIEALIKNIPKGKDGRDGKDGKDVPTKSIMLIITRDGKEKFRVDVPLNKAKKVVEIPLESIRGK